MSLIEMVLVSYKYIEMVLVSYKDRNGIIHDKKF